ncbi:unnamed protein product [Rotaria sp. Silwood2]|nr:unnamed protein product [Rotaria sp. Silwood2]
MSLLLQANHKECREENMTVREEMKKLTGIFFNHRQVSVQKAIYRATNIPLTYSSRGFVFVPAHSNSYKFLKPQNVLQEMDPNDENIYMSHLADKYFDRPKEPEFDICMADFASEYDIVSVKKSIRNPRTPIIRLQTLNFAVKKRCNRNAIIQYPYFNRETDRENYSENLLSLYLPIRSEVFVTRQQCVRKVKDIVHENQRKYEAHVKETESLFNELSLNMKGNEWAEIVANKEKNNICMQTYFTTDETRPLLESMNKEQQEIFYHIREWCINRLHNPDTEPLRLFTTGGAGTEPDENIHEIHTLITACTGTAAVNVDGVTIHSAFGINYRCKLHSLQLLFIDEVSLIQASLSGVMHSRLTQIMGIHSNTAIFGNVGIIAFGDF